MTPHMLHHLRKKLLANDAERENAWESVAAMNCIFPPIEKVFGPVPLDDYQARKFARKRLYEMRMAGAFDRKQLAKEREVKQFISWYLKPDGEGGMRSVDGRIVIGTLQ